MLRPKTLTHVLSQAVSGGVGSALLLNKEGTLLAFSGLDDRAACLKAALASSIWVSYERSGGQALAEQQLTRCTTVCADGTLMVQPVASVLVALQADADVPIGMLKAKIEALVRYLEQPLSQIANI